MPLERADQLPGEPKSEDEEYTVNPISEAQREKLREVLEAARRKSENQDAR